MKKIIISAVCLLMLLATASVSYAQQSKASQDHYVDDETLDPLEGLSPEDREHELKLMQEGQSKATKGVYVDDETIDPLEGLAPEDREIEEQQLLQSQSKTEAAYVDDETLDPLQGLSPEDRLAEETGVAIEPAQEPVAEQRQTVVDNSGRNADGTLISEVGDLSQQSAEAVVPTTRPVDASLLNADGTLISEVGDKSVIQANTPAVAPVKDTRPRNEDGSLK